jgi:hypothetical protein
MSRMQDQSSQEAYHSQSIRQVSQAAVIQPSQSNQADYPPA